MTSVDARNFASDAKIKYPMLVVIVFTMLAELYTTLKIRDISRKIAAIVKEVAGKLEINESYYEYRVLKPAFMFVLYGFHVMLLCLLMVIVYNTVYTAPVK
jgi:hypothetical protein